MRNLLSFRDRPIIVIIVFSVAVRLAMALFLGNEIEEIRGGTYDQHSYHQLAIRVADGEGFSFNTFAWPFSQPEQPTAHWSYLYTLFLALVYLVMGINPLVARLIQAFIVGVAAPLFAFRLGARVFGRRTGLIAAALTAAYAYFVLYSASLMTESTYIVTIMWVIDVAMRFTGFRTIKASRRRFLLGLELGLAMGCALLLRQVIVAFLLFVLIWIIWVAWQQGTLKETVKSLAVSVTLVILLLLPFLIRNYRVFGFVTMPNTNSGFAFFWANHPIYDGKFEAVLSEQHGVTYQELIPAELRSLNEAQLDRALLRRGVDFVLAHPGEYLRLTASRVPVYFIFWPTNDSTLISNLARVLSFGLLLPFMIAGTILAIRQMQQSREGNSGVEGQRSEPSAQVSRRYYLVLLLGFMVIYSAIHLLSWANVRYRLPVDAVWLVFAAYALYTLAARIAPTNLRQEFHADWG